MFTQTNFNRGSAVMALTLLIAFTSITAFAQKSAGIRAGISLNSFNPKGVINDDFDGGSTVGYTAELMFNLPLGTSGISVAPGIGFTYDQGGNYSTELQASQQLPAPFFGIEKGTDAWNSIHLSSLLKYTFQGKTISPYFETGPLITFNLSGDHQLEGLALVQDLNTGELSYAALPSGPTEIEFGSSQSDVYKSATFAWAVGTGLSAEFEFGTLSFGIRYSGVNIRSKESESGPAGLIQGGVLSDGTIASSVYGSDDKLKLRTLAVQLGYSISIGGY